MKNLIFIIPVFFLSMNLNSQNGSGGTSVSSFSSFIDFQKTLQRPAQAMNKNEQMLKKQFDEKNLEWPARYVYIRSFKYDSQLEVWVKNEKKEKYKLFKTYKVCALAGTLGPKRMEGDYQVPEGFYYINEFNPLSQYHLSLGLNYPNISDLILSDSRKPGGEIYIHGSCVTVGCIPLTDPLIEELYIITAHAKDQGQDFIPVHIFPVRFNVQKSAEYLNRMTREDASLAAFTSNLEDAFNFFEKNKQVPVVMVTEKGEYIVNNPPAKNFREEAAPVVKKVKPQRRTRHITDLTESVHQWPQYPGGIQAYSKYLEMVGKDLEKNLPKNIRKAYVLVEFVVDKDGTPVNFKVIRGSVNEDFDEDLITTLEKTMASWKPALLNDKHVAKKMAQTITIEIPEPMEF